VFVCKLCNLYPFSCGLAGAGRDAGDDQGKEPDLRDAVKQDKVKKAKKAGAAAGGAAKKG
jgi:hypothetical protein